MATDPPSESTDSKTPAGRRLSPDNEPQPRSLGFGWPLAFTVVALATMLSGLYIFYSLRQIPGAVADQGREVLSDLADLASAMNQQHVETSFLSYATRMSGSSYFQFATLDQMEIFERKDYATTLWGQLALPEVIVSARAPVQYTYFLDLEADWDFVVVDNLVTVEAPPIRFNKPSIDVSQIVFDVEQDSLFRDEALAQDNLRKGLSSMAHRRAQENVDLVREVGRRKTEDFVRTWLLSSFKKPSQPWNIQVVFADEQVPLLDGRESTFPDSEAGTPE